MNGRLTQLGSVLAAALLIAGILMAVLPQYGPSIVQLVIMTVAVTSGVYAVVTLVPEWSGSAWWSPFDDGHRSDVNARPSTEVDRIRATLSDRRSLIDDLPPMPLAVPRLLRPLIQVSLDRAGVDTSADASGPDRVDPAQLVAPMTWSIYTCDSRTLRPWYKTRRPSEQSVSEAVHAVLDDLERLDSGPGRATPSHHVDST